MNKNTIVLADNSYTIRRIVELSFAEEEGIELVSLENGLNLKDKLLETKPAVVLVDIKLPEINGYDVCKFINEAEELKDTKVFLMKGGFEPVDENLLKELTFIDIITKPFDSNALVTRLKEILDKPADGTAPAVEEMPSSLPEDVPEIDNISETGEEINFSDIKDEIESEKIIPEEEDVPGDDVPREDVLPSEEKTQGSQFEKEDNLSFENIEEIENPFKDEKPSSETGEDSLSEEERKVKEHIKEQEKELEIGSLTQEEINIKQIIEKQKTEPGIDPTPKETKEDTAEHIEDTLAEKDDSSPPEPPTIEIDDQRDTIAPPDLPSGIEMEERTTPTPSETTADLLTIKEPPKEPAQQEPMEISLEPKQTTEDKDMKIEFAAPPEPAAPSPIEAPEPTPPTATDKADVIEKEVLIDKVEDTLTVAVKEILWEIIPPLAEKIIKEEIHTIKNKIDNSGE